MWLSKEFSIKDLSRLFFGHGKKKINVGFFIPGFKNRVNPLYLSLHSYKTMMPSTRLRVVDVMIELNKTGNLHAEFVLPWREYDFVIFQKKFNENALKLAKSLKKRGTKIFFDINVNYYDNSSKKIREDQYNDVMAFTEICNGILTPTQYLKDFISTKFPDKKIYVIPEMLMDRLFFKRKEHHHKDEIVLIYAGYSSKAEEIYIVGEVLKTLGQRYNLLFLFICERDPKIEIENVRTKFLEYDQKYIEKFLIQGDIFVSPRDLNEPYNLGHSFTKIGYPMSVGLPVATSPIPSYKNSPAVLCESRNDWESALEELASNHNRREELSVEGVKYCKQNFSAEVIIDKYIQMFRKELEC